MTVTMRQAINRALADALEADEEVFLLGEDIAGGGGPFKITDGLLDRFGPRRVYDTPISEQAIAGCAIGAALQGLRPVAEIMFADFAAVCFDQLVNQMAKMRYMSGGQVTVPVTVRFSNGAGVGLGCQHSQTGENWFLNVPGLKLVAPSNPADAYGLLRAAIDDPDPVLYFEHKGMYNDKGELPDEPEPMLIGRAAVVREGDSATVVATQAMVREALAAADELAAEGVSIEVIDLRTIMPFDAETVGKSVETTNHLVVVEESPFGGCWGSTVMSAIVSERFESLDRPPLAITADRTPIPFGEAMEHAWMPSAARIVAGVKQMLEA